MDSSKLVERVQELTDVELAILLSLIADQHCIIKTEEASSASLEEEIQLIASNVFGLSHTVLHCSNSTTLEDFSDGILVDAAPDYGLDEKEVEDGPDSVQGSPRRKRPRSRGIANIVIITGLPMANDQVQVQALELLRTRRIFTHTSVHTAPKMFVLVILNSSADPRLVHHLNDQIFISHYHDPEDGFANLEQGSEWVEDDRASLSSVVRRSAVQGPTSLGRPSLFAEAEIRHLAVLGHNVTVSAEAKSYLQNIVTFLRMHRAVGGGVSPRATQHFDRLVKCLAPLHGLEFVTPSLVSLAARKIYPHRIAISSPENERSMQYGSDLAAIALILEGVRPEDVVEDVLEQVEVPL
ncbi:hypothetical protein MMC28_008038 [Mycoblastus sanguinarius]|nr:hypothetical protein [Mycoblastus sanguinarius]